MTDKCRVDSVAAPSVAGTRIRATVNYFLLAGLQTWAVAQLVANGIVADSLLFGVSPMQFALAAG